MLQVLISGSINHTILYNQLERKLKDKKILALLNTIIDSYSTSPDTGIPIGNLTSQYFANYYLSGLDRFITETLKACAYVRYMDDFLVFYDSPQQGKLLLEKIRDYTTHFLRLTLKPPLFCATKTGFAFLGFKVSASAIRLTSKTKKRFLQRFAQYETSFIEGIWSIDTLTAHIQPLFSWLRTSASTGYRNTIITNRRLSYT